MFLCFSKDVQLFGALTSTHCHARSYDGKNWLLSFKRTRTLCLQRTLYSRGHAALQSSKSKYVQVAICTCHCPSLKLWYENRRASSLSVGCLLKDCPPESLQSPLNLGVELLQQLCPRQGLTPALFPDSLVAPIYQGHLPGSLTSTDLTYGDTGQKNERGDHPQSLQKRPTNAPTPSVLASGPRRIDISIQHACGRRNSSFN